MSFESAATRYICQMPSALAANRTRHVGSVTWARYRLNMSLTKYHVSRLGSLLVGNRLDYNSPAAYLIFVCFVTAVHPSSLCIIINFLMS